MHATMAHGTGHHALLMFLTVLGMNNNPLHQFLSLSLLPGNLDCLRDFTHLRSTFQLFFRLQTILCCVCHISVINCSFTVGLTPITATKMELGSFLVTYHLYLVCLGISFPKRDGSFLEFILTTEFASLRCKRSKGI